MFSPPLLWKQGAPGSAAFGNIEWLLVRVTQLASRASEPDRPTDRHQRKLGSISGAGGRGVRWLCGGREKKKKERLRPSHSDGQL